MHPPAAGPLPLVADGAAHTALIPGPGPFSLTLEWGAPLTFRPGRAAFVLPVPQSGTARATFDLPGDQADVRLSSGLVTRRTAADGRTIVEATLDPGSSTEVSWSMRDSAPTAAARELRTLVRGDDAGHARRLRRAHGRADRSHRAARRAAHARRAAADRIRADRRLRQLAREQRAGRRAASR